MVVDCAHWIIQTRRNKPKLQVIKSHIHVNYILNLDYYNLKSGPNSNHKDAKSEQNQNPHGSDPLKSSQVQIYKSCEQRLTRNFIL